MSKFTGNRSRTRGGGRLDAVEFFTRPKRSLPYLIAVAVWHWRWELLTVTIMYVVHVRLVQAGLSHLAAIAIMAAVVGLLAAVAPSRRFLRTRCWCVVARHRLRVCLSELRTMNHSGNAALILGARGTKEGEALWLWMRPGLSVEDLEKRQEAIAAACWARDCRVTRSHRLAALVRVDVLRRDPLAKAPIESPLLGLARRLPTAPVSNHRALEVVRAPGDTRANSSPTGSHPVGTVIAAETSKSAKRTTAGPSPELVVLRNGEDVSDYV